MPPRPPGAAAATSFVAIEEHDPMLAALRAAPLSDELETEEEGEAVDAIQADIDAGRHGASPAAIAAILEQMRLRS